MNDPLPLAAKFPAATREQWLRLVERVLKGRPLDTLVSRTPDGISIAPLYARSAQPPVLAGRAPGARWQVMARVDHPDPAAANAQALEDLNGGADGLVLVSASAVGAHGYGLPATADALERVLDGVHLDAGIAIELDAGAQAQDVALALAAIVKRRGIPPQAVNLRFGIDPFGAALRNGGMPQPWSTLGPATAAFAADLARQGFRRALLVADGRIIHNAGGTPAQELAYTIASAVALLRALEANGIALDDARGMIAFRLTADADQFLTIAKFRALRQLWQRIEASCGLVPEPVFIAADTAWRTMTRNDPAMNILRGAIAACAAGLGGADAISVMPFTAARGLPNAFARRIARNTQLVLLDEANLARVTDPAAGTGWCEALTGDLCRTAWSLFQDIERAGGTASALERGLLQRQVAAARQDRERAVATLADSLVGANRFPDLTEIPAAVLAVARAELPPPAIAAAVEPLVPMRLAAPFEALRDASDRILAASGARPKVYLAPLGSRAETNARITFAKDLFEAGGIEAAIDDGGTNRNAVAAAFKASGATIACLCAPDQAAPDLQAPDRRASGEPDDIADLTQTLRSAGARLIFLATRAAPPAASLPGIDGYVFDGCDALALLQAAHDTMKA